MSKEEARIRAFSRPVASSMENIRRLLDVTEPH